MPENSSNAQGYRHPWARQGSKASKSIGVQRWFHKGVLLLPTPEKILEDCEALRRSSDERITAEDVDTFLGSSVWQWIQWAHSPEGETAEKDIITDDQMDKQFGEDRLSTLDVIAFLRDSPNFARFLFSGDAQQFFQLENWEMPDDEGVRRVGLIFYHSILESKTGMNIAELMVWEPSLALVSLLAVADVDENMSSAVHALSGGGITFEQYTEVMYAFRYSPDIANSVICLYLAEAVFNEDEDGVELAPSIPPDAQTVDGLILWIYEVYLRNERPLEVLDHRDIPVNSLLGFARVGIFNAKLIKECQRTGVEPNLAASMHRAV